MVMAELQDPPPQDNICGKSRGWECIYSGGEIKGGVRTPESKSNPKVIASGGHSFLI